MVGEWVRGAIYPQTSHSGRTKPDWLCHLSLVRA